MTQVGRGHGNARRRVSGWVFGGHVSATSTLLAPSLHRGSPRWAPGSSAGHVRRCPRQRLPSSCSFPERPFCGLKGNRLSQPNCPRLWRVCAHLRAQDAGALLLNSAICPAAVNALLVRPSGRPVRGTNFIQAADSKLNARPGKAVTSDQTVTHEAMENAATFQAAPGSCPIPSPLSQARILLRNSMPGLSHHTASSLATPTATRSSVVRSRQFSTGVVGSSIQRHAFNRNALTRDPSPTGKTCTPSRVSSELRSSGRCQLERSQLEVGQLGHYWSRGWFGSERFETAGRSRPGAKRAWAPTRTGKEPADGQNQGGR